MLTFRATHLRLQAARISRGLRRMGSTPRDEDEQERNSSRAGLFTTLGLAAAAGGLTWLSLYERRSSCGRNGFGLLQSCLCYEHEFCPRGTSKFLGKHASATLGELTIAEMNAFLKSVLSTSEKPYGPNRPTHTVVLTKEKDFYWDLVKSINTGKYYTVTTHQDKNDVVDIITEKVYDVLHFTWSEQVKSYTCEKVTGAHLLVTYEASSAKDGAWCPVHLKGLMLANRSVGESLHTTNARDMPIYTITQLGAIPRDAEDSNLKETEEVNGAQESDKPPEATAEPETEELVPDKVSAEALEDIPESEPSSPETHKKKKKKKKKTKQKDKSLDETNEKSMGNSTEPLPPPPTVKQYVVPKIHFSSILPDGTSEHFLTKGKGYRYFDVIQEGEQAGFVTLEREKDKPRNKVMIPEKDMWVVCDECEFILGGGRATSTTKPMKFVVTAKGTTVGNPFHTRLPILTPDKGETGVITHVPPGWEIPEGYTLVKMSNNKRGYIHGNDIAPDCPRCRNTSAVIRRAQNPHELNEKDK